MCEEASGSAHGCFMNTGGCQLQLIIGYDLYKSRLENMLLPAISSTNSARKGIIFVRFCLLVNTRITRLFAYLELPWCPIAHLRTINVLRYSCFSLNCFLRVKCEHFITVLLSIKFLFLKATFKRAKVT